jgi:shikimate kinase
MKSNIVLIGMPSCGKSTVGVLLAKRLGMSFLDSDLLIQEREGRLLHDIIREEGIDGFIRIENEVNAAISVSRTVISTGGSVIYGEEAMEHLRSIGKVIYLKISYQTLEARLGDYVHRGVVLPDGYTLKDMYDERVKLYERYADLTLDEEKDASLGETLERVAMLCTTEE